MPDRRVAVAVWRCGGAGFSCFAAAVGAGADLDTEDRRVVRVDVEGGGGGGDFLADFVGFSTRDREARFPAGEDIGSSFTLFGSATESSESDSCLAALPRAAAPRLVAVLLVLWLDFDQ